ncbi:MAG: Xaa-Pro peptidase family protein [Candidatus Symbiothrix sp.]|jgi:Xaa-Pro aminopeptidase|nr:Xaa-Pro peptidase family protein [Candidatus Symbiothrix sp.]
MKYGPIQQAMQATGADACLLSSNVNIYYLTGQVFAGFVYLPAEGDAIWFVQRPAGITAPQAVYIRKPEDIPGLLLSGGLPLPNHLLLEADQITHNEFLRLEAVFHPRQTGNATPLLRQARMLKTPEEIAQMRLSARRHAAVYQQIPSLFREGMTDLDLQYEIENRMRQKGSIGVFRTFGSNMDIFMGSVLTGDNAATPSPFDFALGGGGPNPFLPIGANGTPVRQGQTVMVDMAGNFTAYLTDMTRVYAYGALPDYAYEAHQLSIDMNKRFLLEGKPGVACSEIYNWSVEKVEAAGFKKNFMGITQQAKFVGHGLGLEINEPPVLMQRSKEVLQAGMTIAYEPKFVFPGVGAVGIENTYLVTETGVEKLTVFTEDIIPL